MFRGDHSIPLAARGYGRDGKGLRFGCSEVTIPSPAKKQRILICGGSGFLGRALALELDRLHAKVTLTYHRRVPQDLPPTIRVLPLDVRHPDAARDIIERVRPSALYHLAADTRVQHDMRLLVPQLETNVLGGARLLEAAATLSIPRIIWVSTCEEYGEGPVPFHEDQYPDPLSPYSLGKLAGTFMAQMAAKTFDVPILILRPFLTYGPRQPPHRFIAQAISAALDERPFSMTSGEQTRDLVYIDDTIDAMIRALACASPRGRIINICTGVGYPMIEVARRIFRLCGADPALIRAGALPQRARESYRFYGHPARAKTLLGWEARTPLDDGLAATIAWYRDQRRQSG